MKVYVVMGGPQRLHFRVFLKRLINHCLRCKSLLRSDMELHRSSLTTSTGTRITPSTRFLR